MSRQGNIDLVHRFFSGTGASYDTIVNLCTAGLDKSWKEKLMQKVPPKSTRIMDQACGTGILTMMLAHRHPHARIVGVELRDEYLSIARDKLNRSNVKNVEFILGNAEDVVIDPPFDCIVSSYLAKYVDLDLLIRNASAMLEKNGVLIMHDFIYPPNRLLAKAWGLYFKMLQTLGSRKYPEWKTVFYELPRFLEEAAWMPRLCSSLKNYQFKDIKEEFYTFGVSAVVSAVR
jgi:demethylmenaquinone methyltransferase/2-methoxy-6-polyprenyl-1,4-benzoquinol methylase